MTVKKIRSSKSMAFAVNSRRAYSVYASPIFIWRASPILRAESKYSCAPILSSLARLISARTERGGNAFSSRSCSLRMRFMRL